MNINELLHRRGSNKGLRKARCVRKCRANGGKKKSCRRKCKVKAK